MSKIENNENNDLTGLSTAVEPKERKNMEFDLLTNLLAASDFKNDSDLETEVEIKRNNRVYFTVHIHPISDEDVKTARKRSTTYMKNPNNAKLPPIEKERNTSLYQSWLIFLATTEKDQKKIWGNPEFMNAKGCLQPVETIDKLLMVGEKLKLVDLVTEISGFNEDMEEVEPEDYAKN